MNALIEHKHPTPATQKNVLAASGNQCAHLGCNLAHLVLHFGNVS